jgi:ethanolamine-phosphate cytidylyltransferase
VGLVGDEDIVRNKGSEPVIPFEERLKTLTACKFVDEVIINVSYDLTEELVNTLLRDHDVDFIAHGDDPCVTADGKDAYAYPKSIGCFRMFKRTEGVSTTDLVGRMLLSTREHHIRDGDLRMRSVRGRTFSTVDPSASSKVTEVLGADDDDDAPEASEVAESSVAGMSEEDSERRFMPTSRRIAQFADGRTPHTDDKVVYIAGSWDVFNEGHVAALLEAKKHGTFLLVGVYDDETVHRTHHGIAGGPVMNLFERALSVLACRFVDDVVMGAPLHVSQELIRTFKIDKVLRGSKSEARTWTKDPALFEAAIAVPRRLGVFFEFKSPSELISSDVVGRVLAKREMFAARYQRKSAAEDKYRSERAFVEEA